MVLRWEMSVADALPKASNITCTLPVVKSNEKGEESVTSMQFSPKCASRIYDRERNVYVYESEPITHDLDLEEGRRVSMEIRERPLNFKACIPLSAVEFLSSNSARVYTIEESDGELRIYAMQVTVAAQDDQYVGINNRFELPVVVYASRPIADGTVVRMAS